MWQASSAMLAGVAWLRSWAWRARSRPTVNDPEEPRPVPEGMSATLTSSIPGDTGCSRRAWRMIGCSMSSTRVVRSSSEYLRK